MDLRTSVAYLSAQEYYPGLSLVHVNSSARGVLLIPSVKLSRFRSPALLQQSGSRRNYFLIQVSRTTRKSRIAFLIIAFFSPLQHLKSFYRRIFLMIRKKVKTSPRLTWQLDQLIRAGH